MPPFHLKSVPNIWWNSQLFGILYLCIAAMNPCLIKYVVVINQLNEWDIYVFLYSPFTAGRYHSLVIEKESFPSDVLEITAWTENGLIMGARHKVHWHLQVTLTFCNFYSGHILHFHRPQKCFFCLLCVTTIWWSDLDHEKGNYFPWYCHICKSSLHLMSVPWSIV